MKRVTEGGDEKGEREGMGSGKGAIVVGIEM